ncbi:2OG-Fe(II) oxygenase superfamily [Musa troglodytarum]|uniref:2-oxoglutarate-dependent dioxygenase DAO n=1 Tax=Musa troglodytarum TaxID=320322 RepID=A0A9E7FZW5_9LILI|nr:2OG-Fe(II) oxygenase superfamily [Musa troglodytarum]
MQRPQFPVIDFSSFDPAADGGPAWDATREHVMQALGTCGCFEVVYDRITPELRQSLLEVIAKDLFRLPLETKLKNASEKVYDGYLGRFPNLDYESLAIRDATGSEAIPSFASLMWPDGNPNFCEMASSFAKKLAELQGMIRKMVLQSLGVAEYHEEQMQSTWHLLRFSEYGAPGDETRKVGQMAHRDANLLTAVCQLNGVDGLEVETREGQWIQATPSSPTSFFIIAGESFWAWSNGKVYSPMHGVTVGGKETRYSVLLFAMPKNERPIQAPVELVDDNQTPIFKPYYYDDYLRFCFSEEGMMQQCKLVAYCGTDATTEADA